MWYILLTQEVVTATVDVADIHSFRAGIVSRNTQAAQARTYPEIQVSVGTCTTARLSKPVKVKIYTPSEEIRYGPACWLWDYLRRSKSGGFFLPSSGGIDSCATALIVYSMCELVIESLKLGSIIY
jgi:NAD+ synthase (glutamine-hydrolysing)